MTNRCHDPLFGEIPPRLPLAEAPLVRVLGQVRFPKILKISEEGFVADFQEAIRKDYPHLQKDLVRGVNLTLSGEEVQYQQMKSVIWRFFDPTKTIRVSLAQDAITLETASYASRDEFLGRIRFILDHLKGTIAPASVERVGLRYVNRIQDQSQLESLAQLIQPEILNILQPSLVPNIEGSMMFVSGTTAEGKITAHYGLVPAGISHNSEITPPVEVRSWVLDIDSYSTTLTSKKFDVQMLYGKLNKVAERAYSFFRWSITEKFLERFGAKK